MAHQVIVPPLGQTTDTVVLSSWYVHVGETVKFGQPLFAIETDKATLDIEAQADGVLSSINANDGDTVAVLSVIGVIAAPEEKVDPAETWRSTAHAPARVQASQAVPPAQGANMSTADTGQGRVFISPRARRFAETRHLDWHALKGTGPMGAIVERDVRRSMEQTRAEAMTSSADVPAVPAAAGLYGQGHLSAEISVSGLVALQMRLSKHGLAISLDSITLFILARAIGAGCSMRGSQASLCIGVSAIQDSGYKTHWLEQVDRMSLLQVRQALDTLPAASEDAASDGAIQFTYMNIGNYGLDFADAVVDADVTFVAGQVRRGGTGDAVMWVSLNYRRSKLTDTAAIQLMHSLVRLAEDPDLLF